MHRSTRVMLYLILLFCGMMGSNSPVWARDSSDLNPRRTVLMLPAVWKGDIITQVDTGGRKLAALTFDDGPDPVYTPQVLKILKEHEVKATFFVVGENARAHPGIIRQAILAGHEIENHTYSHPELDRDTLAEVVAEIVSSQTIIEGMTGREPLYFRPPKKLYNQQVIKSAHASRLQVVLWTVCVENQNSPTPALMAERVLKAMRPGTIILAHDGRLRRDKTVQALPEIIAGYQQQNYSFVTLSELIAAGES